MTRAEAAYRIAWRYFEIAGFGNERAIARVLALEPALVESAARRLERERKVRRGMRVDGLVGEHSILTALID